MANTFSQIHIHLVFATQFRNAFIAEKWEQRLYEYLISIIHNQGHKVLAINGMPDHVHILIGLRPNQVVSELVQQAKASSSRWINEERLCPHKFAWQEGYGAFSYTKSDVPKVIHYIQNQKAHHQKIGFVPEYKHMLTSHDIDFDPKYIFHEPA